MAYSVVIISFYSAVMNKFYNESGYFRTCNHAINIADLIYANLLEYKLTITQHNSA